MEMVCLFKMLVYKITVIIDTSDKILECTIPRYRKDSSEQNNIPGPCELHALQVNYQKYFIWQKSVYVKISQDFLDCKIYIVYVKKYKCG